MENVIIDELTKKKLSTWKRIASFLLDSVMMAIVILGLFYTVGTYAITYYGCDAIGTIDTIYAEECAKQNVHYKVSNYGIYQLDKDSYLTQYTQDGTHTFDEAMEAYNNLYYEIDTAIQSYPNYSTAYQKFTTAYYLSLIVCFFIASFIFLFLIPILHKKHKTIGMMIIKASLVDDKTNIITSNVKVFLRWFTIFSIEICIVYAIAQVLGILFLMIINIILISFSKKKKTLHDFATDTHLEKDEYSYTA